MLRSQEFYYENQGMQKLVNVQQKARKIFLLMPEFESRGGRPTPHLRGLDTV